MARHDISTKEGQLQLRQAFSAFPTGVVAVCALGEDGTPVGMAVNSFTSISLDPPLVAISLANTSHTWPALSGVSSLGLSILGDTQEHLSRQLSSRSGDRFSNAHWTADDDGAVHMDGSALWLTCHIRANIAGGDHTIVLLTVDNVQAFPEVDPLVFHHSRYRSFSL